MLSAPNFAGNVLIMYYKEITVWLKNPNASPPGKMLINCSLKYIFLFFKENKS